MGINDLPSPGIKFRATTGAGNFQRKLSSATRYGGLKNLRDNQKAIVETVKKYQSVIRIKGGLSRLQRRDAWLKVKKSTPKLTYADKHETKAIFKHLGRGAAVDGQKSTTAGKMLKTSSGKSIFLTEKQIKANLRRTMRNRIYDESGSTGRGATYVSNQYAEKVESYGVRGVRDRGTMEDLGVSRGKVGFAGGRNIGNLSNSSAPKAPLGGIKPTIPMIGNFTNN